YLIWLTETDFMQVVIVAVASYLSQDPLQCFYLCPYRFIKSPIIRLMNFFFLICIILLCSISCSRINGSVVDCAADDDLFVFNSIMSSHLSCKIRFEGPIRHPEREVKRNDAACKVYFNYKFAQH
ncbi:MAG: hypothetical protein M3297_15340, partial [Thermoproteota archaeon]|nr:hypothetical protein [Thermoproteota archaeon]